MKSTRAAKSYARALFSLAKERSQAPQIGDELERMAALLRDAPGLTDVLTRPWIAASTKRTTALELGTRAELSPLGRDFLALVASRGRIAEFDTIVAAYRELVDADAGRARAHVRTAVALTDDERRALASRLARELGVRDVVLDEVVDPNLIGGFVAEVGSLVLDASLNGQLARMRERLANA